MLLLADYPGNVMGGAPIVTAGPQAVTGVDLNVGDDLTFTYDLRGNMATKAKAGVVSHIYTFDAENRLASVRTGNQTMSFAYDADGQRVMTTRHDGTIIYTPFPDYEVEDPPTGDNIVRTTYRLAGQIVAVQTKAGGNPGVFYYTYSDHLGNVVLLSYTGGTPFYSSLARYDPFGNYRTQPAATTNPAITSHGFTGHRHNNTGVYPTQNVGLIYMNARYYLPEIGRFISPDSIVPDPSNPQSFNRYSYVLNSPTNYSDPTGHREADCMGRVCSAPPAPTPATPLIIFDAVEGEEWTSAEMTAVRNGAWTNAKALARTLNASNWRDYRQSIRMGEGGSYTSTSARDAFLSVYGGSVTFYKTGTACGGEGCYGMYAGDSTINVYTDIYRNGVSQIPSSNTGNRWAVHELGHAFEARVNETVGVTEYARNQLGAATNILRRGTARDPDSGFAGDFSGWQQSRVASPGEELADMYLGWTYGRWGSGPQGHARSAFMVQHMSFWVNLLGQ